MKKNNNKTSYENTIEIIAIILFILYAFSMFKIIKLDALLSSTLEILFWVYMIILIFIEDKREKIKFDNKKQKRRKK